MGSHMLTPRGARAADKFAWESHNICSQCLSESVSLEADSTPAFLLHSVPRYKDVNRTRLTETDEDIHAYFFSSALFSFKPININMHTYFSWFFHWGCCQLSLKVVGVPKETDGAISITAVKERSSISIKAKEFHVTLKGSYSYGNLCTVSLQCSHFTHRQSWLKVIDLCWAVRHNLKVLSVCNLLGRLPHAPLQYRRSIQGTSLSPE